MSKLFNQLALACAPTDSDREMVINKMIEDAGGSGVMDADKEAMEDENV